MQMINIDAGKIFIPRLTITDSERTTITIIPEDKYFVDKKYIVIFYKITLINDNGQVDVKIPYYMSDGGTNGVRINALLPFMCFNDNIKSGCPTSQKNIRGLLFKYKVCNNISFNRMTQKIKNSCLDVIKIKKDTEDLIKKEDIYQSIANSKYFGPYTFLPRIENVLDFLICLSSNKIKNISGTDLSNQKKYIPNYGESNKIKIYYEDNEILEEIMARNTQIFNDSKQPLPVNDTMIIINSVQTCYRFYLLKSLNKLYKALLEGEAKICNVEYLELSALKIISLYDFNKIIEICKDSEINDIANQNYINYYKISDKVFEIFRMKINNPIFNSTIVKDIDLLQICRINTLQRNIEDWDATCGRKRYRSEQEGTQVLERESKERAKGGHYEKYLKYKNKYLDLKKLII
jgi:hypothetical protein